MRDLVDETIALYLRMRYISDQMHVPAASTAARRGIIRGLQRYGVRTVPQLAFARSVTRQYTQEVVDELRDDGLVELVVNPAHKRSRLVQLTKRGQAVAISMDEADVRVLGAVVDALPEVTKADFATAVRTLRAVRLQFEANA
jgi:DNA-binding MarR family transcriptional regulator